MAQKAKEQNKIEKQNKYFGRKKGKSFLRLEQYTKYLVEPKKTLFSKIKTPRILEIGIGDGEKISEDAKSYVGQKRNKQTSFALFCRRPQTT